MRMKLWGVGELTAHPSFSHRQWRQHDLHCFHVCVHRQLPSATCVPILLFFRNAEADTINIECAYNASKVRFTDRETRILRF